MFSLTMLGSGSAGNSALVATEHCKILVDGGLSALCRKFHVPIYCNALTAEAIRSDGLFEQVAAATNWRIFRTGSEFSICDMTVQTFPVPHDAVDPLGFAFHAGSGGLGFITDLGYPTKMVIERLREVQTLVIETNHDEKLLQNDTHRPWPVKQRIQSRHGHLSNAAAAGVIEELLSGKIERVVLGHLSRDCNTPELAVTAVRGSLAKHGKIDLEIHIASQSKISARFRIGETNSGPFQPTFENAFFQVIPA
ncbi:MAG: metal-dependent hydrolase [Verrucomicrobia bacterium]|nr:MAG: metal-dependent hydrolase [Verrucomicrobiota bacterium]